MGELYRVFRATRFLQVVGSRRWNNARKLDREFLGLLKCIGERDQRRRIFIVSAALPNADRF